MNRIFKRPTPRYRSAILVMKKQGHGLYMPHDLYRTWAVRTEQS